MKYKMRLSCAHQPARILSNSWSSPLVVNLTTYNISMDNPGKFALFALGGAIPKLANSYSCKSWHYFWKFLNGKKKVNSTTPFSSLSSTDIVYFSTFPFQLITLFLLYASLAVFSILSSFLLLYLNPENGKLSFPGSRAIQILCPLFLLPTYYLVHISIRHRNCSFADEVEMKSRLSAALRTLSPSWTASSSKE